MSSAVQRLEKLRKTKFSQNFCRTLLFLEAFHGVLGHFPTLLYHCKTTSLDKKKSDFPLGCSS